MARTTDTVEFIKENSFMSLMASEGQIPGVTAAPIDAALRAQHGLFEVVGAKRAAKKAFSLRIVRPSSWGKRAHVRPVGGAFAH